MAGPQPRRDPTRGETRGRCTSVPASHHVGEVGRTIRPALTSALPVKGTSCRPPISSSARSAARFPSWPSPTPLPREEGTLDLPVEGTPRRGHHQRAVHRLRRVCDQLSARCDRVRTRARRLQAVPSRGRTRHLRLRPWPEGLHLVYSSVSSVPHVGTGGRHAPSRSRAGRRRDVGHLLRHSPHAQAMISCTRPDRTAVSSRRC